MHQLRMHIEQVELKLLKAQQLSHSSCESTVSTVANTKTPLTCCRSTNTDLAKPKWKYGNTTTKDHLKLSKTKSDISLKHLPFMANPLFSRYTDNVEQTVVHLPDCQWFNRDITKNANAGEDNAGKDNAFEIDYYLKETQIKYEILKENCAEPQHTNNVKKYQCHFQMNDHKQNKIMDWKLVEKSSQNIFSAENFSLTNGIQYLFEKIKKKD